MQKWKILKKIKRQEKNRKNKLKEWQKKTVEYKILSTKKKKKERNCEQQIKDVVKRKLKDKRKRQK